MLQEVNSGNKILAEQYNDLVKAVAGPIYASNQTPFTRTANGVVFNGGQESYLTKAKSSIPAFLETQYSTGELGVGYAAYSPSNPSTNRFSGVFVNVGGVGNFMLNVCHFTNGNLASAPLLIIIDPTSQIQAAVPYNALLQESLDKGKLPLCLCDEDAGLAILQIVDSSTDDQIGSLIAVAGNFKKLGGSVGNMATSVTRQAFLNFIVAVLPYNTVRDVRLLYSSTLWKGSDWLDGVTNVPKLTYTVGTQRPQILPDSYVSQTGVNGTYQNMVLSTYLSSVALVPQKQLGFDPLYQSNTSELYNFDKLDDDNKQWNDVYYIDPPSLSGWDILVRHKDRHPKTSENASYETQCSAYLDYVPLSGFLAADSEIDSIKGTTDTQCSSIQHNGLDSSLQLYKFDDPTTVNPYEQLYGYDLVLRDNIGAKSKVVYAPLSCLSSDISSEVSSIVSVYIEQHLSSIVQIDSADGGLSSIGRDAADRLELFQFSTRPPQELEENSDIVVRDNNTNRVDYVSLSSLSTAIELNTDTELTQNQQCSIQKLPTNNGKQLQLYGFNLPGSDRTLHLTLTYDGVPRYIHENGNGSNPDQYTQFITRDSNNQVIVSYDNVSITAPRVPASQVDNIINEISGDIHNIVINEESELSADLSALSAELSNYWKVDGTYDDNCYGKSIGDTNQTKVFDLTNRAAFDASGVGRFRWSGPTIINDAGNNNVLYAGNYAGSYQRYLFHMNGDWTVDFNNCLLKGPGATNQLDWKNRSLGGDWSTGGTHTMNTLKIGNTTLNETQLQQLLALLV